MDIDSLHLVQNWNQITITSYINEYHVCKRGKWPAIICETLYMVLDTHAILRDHSYVLIAIIKVLSLTCVYLFFQCKDLLVNVKNGISYHYQECGLEIMIPKFRYRCYRCLNNLILTKVWIINIWSVSDVISLKRLKYALFEQLL